MISRVDTNGAFGVDEGGASDSGHGSCFLSDPTADGDAVLGVGLQTGRAAQKLNA